MNEHRASVAREDAKSKRDSYNIGGRAGISRKGGGGGYGTGLMGRKDAIRPSNISNNNNNNNSRNNKKYNSGMLGGGSSGGGSSGGALVVVEVVMGLQCMLHNTISKLIRVKNYL